MKRRIIPLLIILAGVALFLLGWARGEAQDVLVKAINLCFECMGLGR